MQQKGKKITPGRLLNWLDVHHDFRHDVIVLTLCQFLDPIVEIDFFSRKGYKIDDVIKLLRLLK